MAELKKCARCGKEIRAGDPCHFVKAKGQPIKFYCEQCVKGESRHGNTGKRN